LALDFIALLSVVGGLLWFLVKADENLEEERSSRLIAPAMA